MFFWTRVGVLRGMNHPFINSSRLSLAGGGEDALQFEGLGRYCAVLFPFQIWIAAVASDAWRPLVFAGYGLLYGLALTMFTTLHPLF